MNTKKYKKGQMMLVTLLILMVLAIVVIGLAILLNRDVKQVTQTAKYEQIYNSGESEIIRLISTYGNNFTNVDQLTSDFEQTILSGSNETSAAGSTTVCNTLLNSTAEKSVQCKYLSKDFSTLPIDAQMTVSDSKDITNLQLETDRDFAINLNDGTNIYKSGLTIQYKGNLALDMMFVYKDATGEMKTATDIFDNNTPKVYDSLLADNPFTTPNANHRFTFQNVTPDAGYDKAFKIVFNAANITNYNDTYTPVQLTLTPRSKTLTSTEILVRPDTYVSYPYQIRNFAFVGYDVTDLNTPVVNVQSYINLFPQVDSIFTYSLLTDDSISL